MNEEKTAQDLTKDDFIQAVAKAGGPKAVQAALDDLRLSNEQLDKEFSRILEQYPRHWIAMGPNGMIGNVPVPEDSSEEDEEQALERLFELIGESGSNRNGYLVRYIDAEAGALIL
jgi:NAD(P)H-dependent flavin oxidoreductase YrpB (nitropropane dioxygenase family)